MSRIWMGTFLALVASLGWIYDRETENRQPIQYNHQKHVEELGLGCEDCHENVESGARAWIPNIEICGGCHFDLEADNLEQRKVAQFVESQDRIPWIQVHTVPDHAYFSHRRHVKQGSLGCETCHGKVGQMESPFLQPYVAIEMDWCIECHEQKGASTDCYACHR